MPRNLFALILLVVILVFAKSSLADDNLPATDRLKSCDPRIALAAAKEILSDANTLKEPLEMFPPAFILFQNGEKDEAVFWFYAAQLRVRYQLVFEKGDRGQLLSVMLMTVGPPINNYAFQDVRKLNRIIDRVLEWDKSTPNPFREKPRTGEIEVKLEKVYSGLHDLRIKLAIERDDIERKARAAAPQLERMYLQSKTRPCRSGEPDPAYANRTIDLEKKSVTEFAKRQPEVLREAGMIKDASVASYRRDGKSSMPSRYTVSIRGTKKTIYAEIDVSRSGSGSSFALACVTSLWIGQRDPFKDVCAQ